jgi:hypothetical protein
VQARFDHPDTFYATVLRFFLEAVESSKIQKEPVPSPLPPPSPWAILMQQRVHRTEQQVHIVGDAGMSHQPDAPDLPAPFTQSAPNLDIEPKVLLGWNRSFFSADGYDVK